jgi:hypothetical protein
MTLKNACGRLAAGSVTAAVFAGLSGVVSGIGPSSFLFLQAPFTQEIFGATSSLDDPDFGILGGVAFAPDGDVWSSECVFAATRLHRFDLQSTVIVNGTAIHPESIVATEGGCGLTNHPDGSLYSNSQDGVWKLDANTGLPAAAGPFGPNGNALGIAVDPKPLAGNHLIYVGADCHPSLSPGSPTCTIYDLDPATNAAKVFARVTTAEMSTVDGIYFDPNGDYLFVARREPITGLTVLMRPAALKELDAAPDDTQIVQDVTTTSGPAGVAFHATEGFVVTLNVSDGGPQLKGTMTRFDFPGGNYAQSPVQSVFASGGFRGELLQVGGDGCLYATQGILFDSSGTSGTRYDDGTETAENSIVKICAPPGAGGFVPPPGVSGDGAGGEEPRCRRLSRRAAGCISSTASCRAPTAWKSRYRPQDSPLPRPDRAGTRRRIPVRHLHPSSCRRTPARISRAISATWRAASRASRLRTGTTTASRTVQSLASTAWRSRLSRPVTRRFQVLLRVAEPTSSSTSPAGCIPQAPRPVQAL